MLVQLPALKNTAFSTVVYPFQIYRTQDTEIYCYFAIYLEPRPLPERLR